MQSFEPDTLLKIAIPIEESDLRYFVKYQPVSGRSNLFFPLRNQERLYITNRMNFIIFVVDSIPFLIPYCPQFLRALWKDNFSKSPDFETVVHPQIPKYYLDKWKKLEEVAYALQEKALLRDCCAYAEMCGVKPLPNIILQKCEMVPASGVCIGDWRYYPIIQFSHLATEILCKLFSFCQVGSKTMFVYLDGKTYISQVADLAVNLRQAGYAEYPWHFLVRKIKAVS